jgi:hypothetical protein
MHKIDPNQSVSSFVQHWGIKGMKWGIRRNNPSSSSSSKSSKDSSDEAKTSTTKTEPPKAKEHNRMKELLLKDPSEMTNAEIQELSQRMNLERAVAKMQYDQSTLGKGEKIVNDTARVVGSVNNLAKAVSKNPFAKQGKESFKQVLKKRTDEKIKKAFEDSIKEVTKDAAESVMKDVAQKAVKKAVDEVKKKG